MPHAIFDFVWYFGTMHVLLIFETGIFEPFVEEDTVL